MQNLRLLFLGGLFLILCTKNVNSMEQLTPAQEHTRVTDIGNAIVNRNYPQVNHLLSHDRGFINRQNGEGKTPLYILLSSQNYRPNQVAYLLAHGADGLQELELAGNITTPLYAAAHSEILNESQRMLILKLLVKKKLIDQLNLDDMPPGPNNPENPEYAKEYSDHLTQILCTALVNYPHTALGAYISNLPMQLRFEITPGTYANPEEYNNASSVYRDVLSWSNKSLRAYRYVKNFDENLANWEIRVAIWDMHFKAFDSKNLLQLSSDLVNTTLIAVICNRIKFWDLHFSSRKPGTNSFIGPRYKNLAINPDINKYYSKCYLSCLKSSILFVVGVIVLSVVLPKAGSYLIDLAFKQFALKQ